MAFTITVPYDDMEAPAGVHVKVDESTTFDGVDDYKDLQFEWDFGDPDNDFNVKCPVLTKKNGEDTFVSANTAQVGLSAVYYYREAGSYTITCRTHIWDGSQWVEHTATATVTVKADTTTAVYYDPDATGDNDGSSPENAFTDIESGLTLMRSTNKTHYFASGKTFEYDTSLVFYRNQNSRFTIFGGTEPAIFKFVGSAVTAVDFSNDASGADGGPFRMEHIRIEATESTCLQAFRALVLNHNGKNLFNCTLFNVSGNRSFDNTTNTANTFGVKGLAFINVTIEDVPDTEILTTGLACGAASEYVALLGVDITIPGKDNGESHGAWFYGGARDCSTQFTRILHDPNAASTRNSTTGLRMRSDVAGTGVPAAVVRSSYYRCLVEGAFEASISASSGQSGDNNSKDIVIDSCLLLRPGGWRSSAWKAVHIWMRTARDCRVRNTVMAGTGDTLGELTFSLLANHKWSTESAVPEEDYLSHILCCTMYLDGPTDMASNQSHEGAMAIPKFTDPVTETQVIVDLKHQGNIVISDYRNDSDNQRLLNYDEDHLDEIPNLASTDNNYNVYHAAQAASKFRALLGSSTKTSLSAWQSDSGLDPDSIVVDEYAFADFDNDDFTPAESITQRIMPVMNGLRYDLYGNLRKVSGGLIIAGAIDPDPDTGSGRAKKKRGGGKARRRFNRRLFEEIPT